MRAYIFIDAENHFIRSTAAAEDVIGSPKSAEALSKVEYNFGGDRFPTSFGTSRFLWNPKLQLFWDCQLLFRGHRLTKLGAKILRAVYCCSFAGGDEKAHEMAVKLREYEFDPIVVRESKALSNRRAGTLKQEGLIEKAKGCDIAIAARMVADAAADLYDCCFLFTSDADFLPAVKAVRRMGKIVCVFGYKAGLSERSPYLHVPDLFVDIGPVLRGAWNSHGKQIKDELDVLGDGAPN